MGHGGGDNETMTFINQTYQRADAFLFGRRTYELFAGYWGAEERARAAAEDPGNHPITDALNTKPKYLVSNTLTERAGRTRPSSPATSRRPSAS
jgi:dihydrofolate reductase